MCVILYYVHIEKLFLLQNFRISTPNPVLVMLWLICSHQSLPVRMGSMPFISSQPTNKLHSLVPDGAPGKTGWGWVWLSRKREWDWRPCQWACWKSQKGGTATGACLVIWSDGTGRETQILEISRWKKKIIIIKPLFSKLLCMQ